MKELDLLCKLEKHHNSLDIYNNKLKKLKENIFVDEMGKAIVDKGKKLEKSIQVDEDIKLELRKVEHELKEYNYKIEEVNNKLYSGDTKDIKQLEKWSIEKQNIKETVNSIETKALELMEQLEKLEKEIKTIENFLQETEIKQKEKSLESKKIEKDLNNNVKIEYKKIKDIEKITDEELLNKYDLIKKNKKTAVAEVKDGICTGCNIGVSTFILEEIRKGEKIIYCELCGRILFENKK